MSTPIQVIGDGFSLDPNTLQAGLDCAGQRIEAFRVMLESKNRKDGYTNLELNPEAFKTIASLPPPVARLLYGMAIQASPETLEAILIADLPNNIPLVTPVPNRKARRAAKALRKKGGA